LFIYIWYDLGVNPDCGWEIWEQVREIKVKNLTNYKGGNKMEQEKKKFLDRERTRRDFLKLTGKSIGGAVVSLSILNFFGIEAEATQLYALPQGLLVADKSKCTGCQRCETLCSSIHDGKVQPFISRIHVSENYNFGQDGPKLNIF